MCFGIFKKKPEPIEKQAMTKEQVIEKLQEDILIHEQWAVIVTEYPQYAESFGDYDWHLE